MFQVFVLLCIGQRELVRVLLLFTLSTQEQRSKIMPVYGHADYSNHECIHFIRDPKTGAQAIIAIHSTKQGPALGGCRLWAYDSEEDALSDVLRLSRGMTYKAAMAKLPLGGGKSVLFENSFDNSNRGAVFEFFGKAIASLSGNYITAEDVGTSVSDMQTIYTQTKHVRGLPASVEGGSGDPSPITAYGVLLSMKVLSKELLQKPSLKGLKVGVQGLGHVGMSLCEMLHEEGADLIVTDINEEVVQECMLKFNAKSASTKHIYKEKMDIFAPCALGGSISKKTIEGLSCSMIIGSANNQLEDEERDSELLDAKGIFYAPDYVVNSGGLINVSYEGRDYSIDKVKEHMEVIRDNLQEIVYLCHEAEIKPLEASYKIARKRLGLT